METDLKPVLVKWIDSAAQEGWGKYHKGVSLLCVTIGHLYEETDEVVVIALSRTTGLYGSYITIPQVAVTEIVPLGPVAPAPKTKCLRKTRPTGR